MVGRWQGCHVERIVVHLTQPERWLDSMAYDPSVCIQLSISFLCCIILLISELKIRCKLILNAKVKENGLAVILIQISICIIYSKRISSCELSILYECSVWWIMWADYVMMWADKPITVILGTTNLLLNSLVSILLLSTFMDWWFKDE